jgi:hypothetical protein
MTDTNNKTETTTSQEPMTDYLHRKTGLSQLEMMKMLRQTNALMKLAKKKLQDDGHTEAALNYGTGIFAIGDLAEYLL